jgi:hypothetical protein
VWSCFWLAVCIFAGLSCALLFVSSVYCCWFALCIVFG